MAGQEESVHQRLMSEAYDKWEKGWSYEKFLRRLDWLHKAAVVLGNLNYQVCNGGWEQWVFNEYHVGFSVLDDIFDEMVSEHKEGVREAAKLACEYEGVILGRGVGDYEYNQMFDDLDEKDDFYYEINDEFMQECEAYLQSRVKVLEGI